MLGTSTALSKVWRHFGLGRCVTVTSNGKVWCWTVLASNISGFCVETIEIWQLTRCDLHQYCSCQRVTSFGPTTARHCDVRLTSNHKLHLVSRRYTYFQQWNNWNSSGKRHRPIGSDNNLNVTGNDVMTLKWRQNDVTPIFFCLCCSSWPNGYVYQFWLFCVIQ